MLSSAPRSIVHLDADAFFASVEQASDPRLRGKPIAVGGEKRGIVASASYEARRFGIYTPMPTAMARRLCPKLIILPGDFEKYELFSRLMFSYAYDFTPDVEIGSIDEGYFDLTGTRKSAVDIAETIRDAIQQSLKLPVSEGIGGNKLVSQIASKLKKPHAFEHVPHGFETQFLSPLENKWLPGIGPKLAVQMNAAGLERIGQIARTPVDLLALLAGSMALRLKRFASGIDERPVISESVPAKSYGEQETFAADTTDEVFIDATLRRMADHLMAKVRSDGKSIRTILVKVRYNDMDEQQASESLHEPTDIETDIYSTLSTLWKKAWQRRVSLRLVSLRLSNVYAGSFRNELSLNTAASQHQARERLAEALDDVRHKYGTCSVFRGHDFVLREKPQVGSEPCPPASGSRPEVKPGDTYKQAVVQRQRLGHSIALRPADAKARQVLVSPGVELRFRIELTSTPRPTRTKPGARRRIAGSVHVPLNVRSYYSFLNSTLSIRNIVDLAVKYDLPAIALADTNNLHGAVEFAQTAASAGIKPIIGAQIQWAGRRVSLFVQDQKGYRRLCQILTALGHRSTVTGPRSPAHGLPRDCGDLRPAVSLPHHPQSNFDFQTETVISDLLRDPEGLIAVSAAAELAQLFPGRFYLEVNDPLAALPCTSPLPCVVAPAIHYERPEDRWKYDVVQSIRTLTLLRQQHTDKRLDGEYHFSSPADLRHRWASHPGVLANTRELADQCSFAFSLGNPQFPEFRPSDGSTPAALLRRLVMAGLRRRYPTTHEKHRAQLEEELAIIVEVGYEEYFLVMWDILRECRRRGIDWITRGSAADSLACYCLEISGVCPIRFDLYFRRFLNKDRMALNKLPDIDVDFPHDRKDDVIDLIFEKYGREQTAIVGGFSTFQSRSAFAEVAKVLGVSDHQARRITERLPHFSRASELAEAVGNTLECRGLPLDQEPYSTALQMACFLDGFPRYAKMHPCGLVLSRQKMDEITPCFISAKGYPTTHFDMDSIECVGLIKMDILAQGGLAVMRDVQKSLPATSAEVRKNGDGPSPPQPRSSEEPTALWDDPQVWQLIAGGSARAVHHIESPAMISLCKMCNVRDIDTLIAIVSVIRPGAANESKKMEFARRYQGLSPVRYPHPSLETCLRSTYGLVVYEEHILQICEAFAGLPPGRADVLRRALAKEKPETIEQIRMEFTECARARGRTDAEIQEVWDLVVGFKGYAFCKAHSTAYGVEAYQSAWLKRYYPEEFMAAVLSNGKGFYSPLVYILECHRLGIPLLPPSIHAPGPAFSVENGKIRVPLLQVKGLATATKDRIVAERQRAQFTSLPDFFLRVRPSSEEMESLIRVGAFDAFEQPRTAQYWDFKALNHGEAARAVQGDQLWLFPPGNLDRLPDVPLTEPGKLQRLRWEEDLLGYPVSAHPLALYPDIAWDTYCPINKLGDYIGQEIVTCGLIIEQRVFHQVTGEPMKFITISDWTGIIETELFARTYKSYGLNTLRYRVLEISAQVEPFENNRGHTLRVLRAGRPRKLR